jgi:hypothetical protein
MPNGWKKRSIERLGLSHRASHRALKVARTLADPSVTLARRHPGGTTASWISSAYELGGANCFFAVYYSIRVRLVERRKAGLIKKLNLVTAQRATEPTVAGARCLRRPLNVQTVISMIIPPTSLLSGVSVIRQPIRSILLKSIASLQMHKDEKPVPKFFSETHTQTGHALVTQHLIRVLHHRSFVSSGSPTNVGHYWSSPATFFTVGRWQLSWN